ncbi:hypothetical protein [Yoonia algicola]|uniref:Uncharacterized protein n=1 Tax=Yoonia algicola TaxID=3137368 RepID=A0AAN0M9V3_9RHOB
MLDVVEPIVMSENKTTECPACTSVFMPKRTNQRYCSRGCQSHASRGNRNIENRQRSWQHYERADRLKEMLYSTPPQERLGMMKHILEFIPHDAGLRNILTDPELHMQPPKRDSRMNIAKAANAYTQKFFGLSIKRYIKAVRAGEVPEGIPLRP